MVEPTRRVKAKDLKAAVEQLSPHAEKLDPLTRTLLAHAQHSLSRYDARKAREDRGERGMAENVCEGCGEEMPESSAWVITEDGDFCEQCVADTEPMDSPSPDDDADDSDDDDADDSV